MRYPPGYRVEKRRKLVRNARALFNRKGFDAVSIDEIMGSVGLTRGGFYSYFNSKSELYALAVGNALLNPPVVARNRAASEAAQLLISAYLSQEHSDDIEGGCAVVSLPRDGSGSDATVKRVFDAVFRGMVSLFEQSLERDRRSDRDRALLMSILCVGAAAVARALGTSQLSGEVRHAALRQALELGGWSSRGPVCTHAARRVARTPPQMQV